MNNELREEYETLQDILKKLYQLLKKAIDECAPKDSIQVVVDSIKSVKADERALTRRMKAGIYKSFTKKEIEQYSKEEAIKKAKKEKEEAERKAREEQIKKEKRIKEFEDAQIVFDGEYKLVYNNGNKVYTKRLDTQLLEKKEEFDYNIYSLLSSVDSQNGTTLFKKYKNNEINVTYDLSNVRCMDRKSVRSLKKLAKASYEKNDNVRLVGFKKRTLKGVLATATVAAMIGLSTLGITNMFKKSNKSDTTKSTYTVSNEVNYNDVETKTNIAQMDDTIVKDTDKIIDNAQESVKTKLENEKAIIEDSEKVIIRTQENIKANMEEERNNNEFLGLEIGSTMELPDMDLYYSSTSENPVGNTKNLSAPTGMYRIDLISIVYKGRCLEVMSNQGDHLDDLKNYVEDKYGEDVKISVNLDVVDEDGKTIYKNVGWVDSDILYQKSNVKTKVMVK